MTNGFIAGQPLDFAAAHLLEARLSLPLLLHSQGRQAAAAARQQLLGDLACKQQLLAQLPAQQHLLSAEHPSLLISSQASAK